jgi:glycosyltransferase involved in cell wall biosynthesis
MDLAYEPIDSASIGGRLDISVIIPIRDGIDTLGRCLASLKQSNFPGLEVIVVDDCSKKDCSEVVRSYGFKSIRLNEPREAEYARNKGSELANGDVLVFIDCDMVIQPDALHRIHKHFSSNHYSAISGVCTPESDQKNLVARYKNLWLYYSYANSPEDFDFWISSIGAVRREVFFALKGFHTTFHTKYGGGDLEFGRRLKQAGQKILLDTRIQGKHLKPYTFWGLLRNDYNRGKGWLQFAVGQKMIPYVLKKVRIANIYPAFIISVAISLLLFLSLLLSPFFKIFLILTLLSALIYSIINYPLFRFFRQKVGTGFLLKAIPLSWVDHLVAGFGVIRGCIGCLESLVAKWFVKLKFQVKSGKDSLQVNGRRNW